MSYEFQKNFTLSRAFTKLTFNCSDFFGSLEDCAASFADNSVGADVFILQTDEDVRDYVEWGIWLALVVSLPILGLLIIILIVLILLKKRKQKFAKLSSEETEGLVAPEALPALAEGKPKRVEGNW